LGGLYGDYSGYGPEYYPGSAAAPYAHGPGPYDVYAPPPASDPNGNVPSSAGPATANTVHINVVVPEPNAQVSFEGAPTSQGGMVRRFESPEVTPGRDYVYDIRAQWEQNGRTVTQTRQVRVQAGDVLTVDFRRSQRATPPPPAPRATESDG
jgi:uncharacterized protein (TIGR03000 family)